MGLLRIVCYTMSTERRLHGKASVCKNYVPEIHHIIAHETFEEPAQFGVNLKHLSS